MQSLCYTQEIWIQTFIFKSGYCENCVGTRSCPMTPLIAIEQAHHLRFEAEITENFPQCIYCIKDICGNLFRCCLWHFCLVIYVELDIKPRKEFCVLFCINSSLDWKYFCNNRKISDLFSLDHMTGVSTRNTVLSIFQVSIFVQIMVESWQRTSPSKIIQQLEQKSTE